MKTTLFLLLLVSMVVCGQEYKLIKNNSSNRSMLVGTITREALQDSNFGWWFNSGYANYDVDTTLMKKIKSKFDNKVITIVLGTWCSDSRREVPRVLKILDYVDFYQDKLFLITVDRDLKGLNDEVNGLEIKYVPTIIVYEDGNEIGRIIESPETSLEKDFAKIVK